MQEILAIDRQMGQQQAEQRGYPSAVACLILELSLLSWQCGFHTFAQGCQRQCWAIPLMPKHKEVCQPGPEDPFPSLKHQSPHFQ